MLIGGFITLLCKFMYLYRAIIITGTSDYSNLTQSEINQYASDKFDFETNYKLQTIMIDDLTLAETTFEIGLSYTDFKLKIDGVIRTWGDVKTISDQTKYIINLLVSSPI